MAVKVAVVGLGAVYEELHRKHLERLHREGVAKIVALCDKDPRRVEVTKGLKADLIGVKTNTDDPEWPTYGSYARMRLLPGTTGETGPCFFTDMTQMLDEVEVDAVFLFLPPWAHGAPEFELTRRGIPFLVEKPLGVDLKVPREIADEVRRRGIITSSGFLERYSPHAEYLRRFLETRELRTAYIEDSHPTNVRGRWTARSEMSRSFHLEHIIHQLDLFRFWGWEPTKVASIASERTPVPEHDQPWAYADVYELQGPNSNASLLMQDVRTLNWGQQYSREQRL
jgi:predicted dehydrogenase